MKRHADLFVFSTLALWLLLFLSWVLSAWKEKGVRRSSAVAAAESRSLQVTELALALLIITEVRDI